MYDKALHFITRHFSPKFSNDDKIEIICPYLKIWKNHFCICQSWQYDFWAKLQYLQPQTTKFISNKITSFQHWSHSTKQCCIFLLNMNILLRCASHYILKVTPFSSFLHSPLMHNSHPMITSNSFKLQLLNELMNFVWQLTFFFQKIAYYVINTIIDDK